ncbi:MAG: molybdopterin-dependent oxidoreductase [Burkholderiales bacterium]|nr:molybdopterin-dependent oxidoreductase [Burkholderiales bacterium]
MTTRRAFLASTSGLALAGFGAPGGAVARSLGPDALPAGALGASELAALPGKVPLIKKTWRPPNFETPIASLREAFTPNDAFFVRYHIAGVPGVDARAWRLEVGGDALDRPQTFTLAQLRSEFEPVEIAAVCQCSGNRRGLFDPHVPGVQWGYGAMGNARWKGARLREVLARAGVTRGAVEIVVDGADGAVLEATPDFVKSIPAWKAMDENTLLAYEMNGEPLPHWNGFPVRLVVPGWTATYWMKHLTSIRASSTPFEGFWMAKAYRIPKGVFPTVDRFLSQEAEASTPITEMVVNSLILAPGDADRFRAGQTVEMSGIAWDAGAGIVSVDISVDGGRSWRAAELGPDLGRFAWRQWRHLIPSLRTGTHTFVARATNRQGMSQTQALVANPAGYHHNVLHRVTVQAG